MRQMRVFRNKYDSPAVVLDKIEWEAFLWVITAQGHHSTSAKKVE
jgi:hypothetical protein